jgi:hypothetical protein
MRKRINNDSEDEGDEYAQNFANIKFECVVPEKFEHYKEYCRGFSRYTDDLKCDKYENGECKSSIAAVNAAVLYLKSKDVWRE